MSAWGVPGSRGSLLWGCLLLGGAWSGGVPGGGVCSRGVPGSGGGTWSGGGVCSGGVSAPGGVPGLGGLVSQHALRQNPPPPVNRMTDRCKNINLVTTLLRPVTMTIPFTIDDHVLMETIPAEYFLNSRLI